MSTHTPQNTMAEKKLEAQSDEPAVENEHPKVERPSKLISLWRGEWKEETRIPLWHEEFHETRNAVAKEWFKTSEYAQHDVGLFC
jgi:hypothetical protein